ncbi:MAG: helix-turn-helix domain-containing protein [Gaiellaceae bacterium]
MSARSNDLDEAVENILRLKRAERLADRRSRDDIACAREFLERGAGPSIRPADAARLLDVSKPTLAEWLERGEIAAVLTPKGSREIPLREVVALLEEVRRARCEGSRRPLGRVIRDRRRRSEETVDLDRLIPRRRRTHRTAELHSLAYHRLVAERLDGDLVAEARRRLANWQRTGRIDVRWVSAWEAVLDRPVAGVARAIGADTARGRALRQTSPFAGVLTEQERRRLSRAVEERMK